eukprot:TRINITY_DN6144_c0_g1_i1.p1 TRINITY_DN6144_c0_g1~~TRINITY_DN6144_c0_g1_i1.p1  ORF type:complete len:167 (-),score=18.10 TRINITY_DN6144_c0_g1_i1:73-573(-)
MGQRQTLETPIMEMKDLQFVITYTSKQTWLHMKKTGSMSKCIFRTSPWSRSPTLYKVNEFKYIMSIFASLDPEDPFVAISDEEHEEVPHTELETHRDRDEEDDSENEDDLSESSAKSNSVNSKSRVFYVWIKVGEKSGFFTSITDAVPNFKNYQKIDLLKPNKFLQ